MTVDGERFDSRKEYERCVELRQAEAAGRISGLRRQVKYELIPAQYIGGRCAERAASYYADFVYDEGGRTVVEDTKGMRTADYILKRKLMLHVHGIRIKEL